MRKSLKTLELIAVFMVYLVMSISVAQAVVISHDPAADVVVGGADASVADNTVTIRWTTDEPVIGAIRYGATLPPSNETEEMGAAAEHELVLRDLAFNRDYYYALIARTSGGDIIDDDGGRYYRFRTGENPVQEYALSNRAEGAEASEAVPFISASVPRYVHRQSISITGQTASRATVRVYLNVPENAVGGVSYDLVTTSDENGEFSFPRVPLSDDNTTLFIWARSLSGEEGRQRYEVTVDNVPPVVADFELPDVSNSTRLSLRGTVSEDVIINATVGNASETSEHRAGAFTVEIPLEDMKSNEVSVTFTDGAGNSVIRRSTIFASTQDPTIYRTNLDTLSPSYVRDVVITGNVTPHSYVVVFVNGETVPDNSWPTGIRDIIKNFGTIISGDQYATYTEDGTFRIPVLLSQRGTTETRFVTQGTPGATAAAGIEEGIARERATDTSFGGYASTREDIEGRYVNRIEVVVISRTGRTSSTGQREITYTRCGFGGDYAVDISDVTPSIVIPEHLRRGMAFLGFTVRLQWQGAGLELRRPTPRITPYKLSESEREEYAIDPEALISPSTSIVPRVSDDGKTISILVNLNRVNYTQEDLDKLDLKDLRLKIPLMLELDYDTEVYEGRTERRVQRECWDINTALDVQVPTDVIPEGLLTWSVGALNDTINVIDKILEPLRIITQVTFYACAASWIVLFATKVYEKYTCVTNGADSDDCRSAKKTARDVDYGMRWICDRVFCPAAPSFATWASQQAQGRGEADIMSEPSGASGQQGEEQPVQSVQQLCQIVVNVGAGADRSNAAVFRGTAPPGGTASRDIRVTDEFYTQGAKWDNFPQETCADEYTYQWETSCMLMDELSESRCLKARAEGDTGRQERYCGNFVEQAFRTTTSFCKVDEINRFSAVSPVDRNTYEFRREGGQGRWYGPVPHTERISETVTEDGRPTQREIERRVEQQGWQTTPLNPSEVQRLGLSVAQSEAYVINPAQDIFTALRCVCLPAIQAYLELWRNMLEAIKQCFQSVLAGGNATTGMCRAVLTTYLCDFIFSVISCFVNAFGAQESGVSTTESSRGIGAFFTALRGAGSDIQQNIQSRYGASELYRTMFTERRLVHAACLFAFTGDWDLDLDTALGGLGSIPVRSEGFIYPATRRFISSDPVRQGRATHIYHIGAGLIAGDTINYRLELVCSANTLCNPDEGFIGGECDCFRSGREQVYDITRELGSGRLDAGDILGRNEGDIYVLVQDSPVRYDTVRLRWRSQRNTTATVGLDNIVPQAISQIGGNPPADCGYNAALGEYRCAFDVGSRGFAMFRTEPQSVKAELNAQGQPIPGTTAAPFLLGERIDLVFDVAKQSPGYDPRSAERDPSQEIPFFLEYRVRNNRGQYLSITDAPGRGQGTDAAVYRIVRDGITSFPRDNNIPGLVLSPTHFTATGGGTGVTAHAYPDQATRRPIRDFSFTVDSRGATEASAWFYVRFIQDSSNVRYEMGSVRNFNTEGAEINADLGTAEVRGIVENVGVELPQSYRGIRITPRRVSGQETPDRLAGRALIFEYARPGTTPASGCDSQDPVTFKVEMELKYPTTIEERQRGEPRSGREAGAVPITATNAVASSETVRDPAGLLQRKVVDVQVQCRGRPSVPECDSNKRVGAECICGAQQCSPTDSRINYCLEEENGMKSCMPYNTCQPRNTLDIARDARQTLTENNPCDCDIDEGNNRMECSSGATCNEVTESGNWQCSEPRVFKVVQPTQSVQPSQPESSARIERGREGVDRWTPEIQAVCQNDTNCVALVKAFMNSETGGNQYSVSWSGCVGLMQFCSTEYSNVFSPGPSVDCCRGYVKTSDRTVENRCHTGQNYCRDTGYTDIRFDPQRSIYAGTDVLLRNMRRSQVNRNIYLLAIAYNAGPNIVTNVLRQLNGRTPTLGNIDQPLLLASLRDSPNYQRWRNQDEVVRKSQGMITYMQGIARSYTEYGGTYVSQGQLPEMQAIPSFESISFPQQAGETGTGGSALLGQVSTEQAGETTLGQLQDMRFIIVGHSFVTPNQRLSPLPRELSRELGVNIVPAGVGGSTIRTWLNPGQGRFSPTRPASEIVRGYDVVLVVLNNQFNYPPPVSSAEVARLDAELRRYNARVIWIGDPPYPAEHRDYGTGQSQWDALEDGGVDSVIVRGDDWLPPGQYRGYRASADPHPTQAVAQAWAQRLAPLIRERLEIAPPTVRETGAEPLTLRQQISAEQLQDLRIIAVGASFVAPNAPLPPALSEALGISVTAGGVCGTRFRHWLNPGEYNLCGRAATIRPSEIVRDYDVILVSLHNQRDCPIDASDVVRLDRELRQTGARVIWIGDPPRPEGNPYDTSEQCHWDALREARVDYVLAEDWPMPSEGYTNLDSGDRGLHVTATGARLWAQRLAPLLLERLSTPALV